jgi:adenosine kinase
VGEAQGILIGIIAPDGRRGMIEHAAEFAAAGIPFIFDPGQGLPMFEAADLATFIEQATWVAVNDYEWQMMQQKTGWSVRDVLEEVQALIVTRGQEGSVIYTSDGERTIPCAAARAVVDPTGCGDAYRAGLIHGLIHGLDWEVTGRIASLMGALKIEVRGTQNHTFSAVEFGERFFENFGMPLPTAHADGKFARALSRVT